MTPPPSPYKMLMLMLVLLVLVACTPSGEPPQGFRATAVSVNPTAPVYTDTPTLTPSLTLTPTLTLTATPTLTATQTFTLTPSHTLTPTQTFTPLPTQPLFTLTAPAPNRVDVGSIPPDAPFTTPEGWSCVEFPCEDDIAGFLERIRVPEGYRLSHVGRFPGQPLQIAYGNDGRLYATVIETPDLRGRVYVLEADGTAKDYSDGLLLSPMGLAFQPGTDILYVSGRISPTQGALWRVLPSGRVEVVLDDLPCCFGVVGNQPNGMVFGPDGYLYLGVGALTDHGEPANPAREQYAEIQPYEAAILRIHPHTGEIETYAEGLRNPADLAFDSSGQFYATDNGILEGVGDRIVQVIRGGHYGFPYWRSRGCLICPPTNFGIDILPDLLPLPDYTLPRGMTVYTGKQFPAAVFDDLFVALWNGTANGQRVVRIDPERVPTDPEGLAAYTPQPFITGLIRPTDVIVAGDGSLVVADYVYGHVWRVSYGDGEITQNVDSTPVFVTSTPRP